MTHFVNNQQLAIFFLKNFLLKLFSADKPTFEGGSEVERFGILNSNLTITCQVIDSNPPVNNLIFYELSTNPDTNEPTREEIKDGYKNYKLETLVEAQMATLIVCLTVLTINYKFSIYCINVPNRYLC